MRVLVASFAETGHIVPIGCLVRALLRRGHTVDWGFPFLYPGQTPSSEFSAFAEQHATFDRLVLPEWYQTVVRYPPGPGSDRRELQQHTRRVARELLDSMVLLVRRMLRRVRADVLVFDSISTVAWPCVIAAELQEVPCVGVGATLGGAMPITRHALGDHYDEFVARETSRTIERRRDCDRFGVDPIVAERNAREQIVFTVPEFLAPWGDIDRSVRLVGPARQTQTNSEPAPQKPAKNAPLVVVSFGSQVSAQPEAILTVVKAASELELRLVVNGGQLAGTSFADALPKDVVFLRQLDQRRTLAQADVFVTHGGFNSMIEAMQLGVPLLVCPIDCDQPINARLIELNGVGLSLDLRQTSVTECRAALQKLLVTQSFRRNADRIRRQFLNVDGAENAADIVELTGMSRRHVTPALVGNAPEGC